jgi:hypothetical protein
MVKTHRRPGVVESAERDAGTTLAVTAFCSRNRKYAIAVCDSIADWLNDPKKRKNFRTVRFWLFLVGGLFCVLSSLWSL